MVNHQIILNYFPNLNAVQISSFEQMQEIYRDLNEAVNLISRKDFDNFYVHHVLHSLALAKCCRFDDHSAVIDIGTGGGFPGIPLAIMFPKVQFWLVDSIGKKIKAVEKAAELMRLENVFPVNTRTELLQQKFDIAVARAVAPSLEIWNWMRGKWKGTPTCYLLKGGDLSEELSQLLAHYPGIRMKQTSLSEIFNEPFFETKKIITLTKP